MMFPLKHQGAYDLGLYSIYEDVERMEAIKKKTNKECKAFCILITNDHSYWDLPKKDGTLANNVTLKNDNTRDGDVFFRIGDTRYRELHLQGQYSIAFKEFKELDKDGGKGIRNRLFKILVIEI